MRHQPPGLLSRAGLTEESLEGPETRIPQASYNQVWELVVAASGEEDFGLRFAERLDMDAFHVIGHLAAKSAAVRQVFCRVVAYSRILHDAGCVELESHGSRACLFPEGRGLTHPWPRHIAEFTTPSAVVLLRHLTGWAPEQVHFCHAAPARLTEHRRVLGVTPLFGQPETCILFAKDFLATPIRTRDPGLDTYLEAYAREFLTRLPGGEEDLPARVRHVIVRGLGSGEPEAPNVEQVASQLALGARTLQRRAPLGHRRRPRRPRETCPPVASA